MFVYSCFFIDLLQSQQHSQQHFKIQMYILSVSASQAMSKAKKQLADLMKTEPDKLRVVKYYLGKVKLEEDATHTYQEIKLSGFDAAVNNLKKGSRMYVDLVKEAIETRLEGSHDIIEIATLLNCEVWNADYGIDENTDTTILKFATQFQEPLNQQGLTVTEPELLEEWHDMVDYAVQYLKPQNYITG